MTFAILVDDIIDDDDNDEAKLHKKRKQNLQMLVFVCTCMPKMVKCKFFFFFFPPSILKIATHLATYGRKKRGQMSVLLGHTYVYG